MIDLTAEVKSSSSEVRGEKGKRHGVLGWFQQDPKDSVSTLKRREVSGRVQKIENSYTLTWYSSTVPF